MRCPDRKIYVNQIHKMPSACRKMGGRKCKGGVRGSVSRGVRACSTGEGNRGRGRCGVTCGKGTAATWQRQDVLNAVGGSRRGIW